MFLNAWTSCRSSVARPRFRRLLKTPFAIGAKVVWMQSGAENEEVAAQAAGLQAVVGACMMTAHRIVVR